MRYSHTQFGWMNLIILACAGAYGFYMFSILSGPFKLIPLGIGVIMLVLLVLFYSMRIEIDAQAVRLSMGIGWITREWLLEDIVQATATRTRIIDGWGIKLTKAGWLYSVSMPNAVRLELSNGKGVLLGTDDSDALLAALAETGITINAE